MNHSRPMVVALTLAGMALTSGCGTESVPNVATAVASTVAFTVASTASGSTEQAGGGPYPAAPYLAELERAVLFGDIWERPGLSPRDRSLVTVAVTQALYRTEELREYLGRALDDGVTREEISELMTHVAMYAGWPSASNASRVATDVYQRRGLTFPPPAEPVDISVDLRGQNPGYPAIPYLSALTRSLLFDETVGIWARPGLSPRDRSLITVAVAQASYATDQLRGHLGRALNNGVTQEEIEEIITHVTFYAGWPTGSNAARVAAEVFTDRGLTLGR
jgi:4-carboxymuconolactone decarboxylase